MTSRRGKSPCTRAADTKVGLHQGCIDIFHLYFQYIECIELTGVIKRSLNHLHKKYIENIVELHVNNKGT